ncbi:hypothetical protein DERF_009676 [Dermatophagoides farinae]|uniref:Uncharacterized protein n=1 Tax=Dermatophagoides farinae TaxID=6954 RepID=A0A922HUF3_DERFA|nr:hypothetical protein DERF_009676 [Dermatophagoides farinae]
MNPKFEMMKSKFPYNNNNNKNVHELELTRIFFYVDYQIKSKMSRGKKIKFPTQQPTNQPTTH